MSGCMSGSVAKAASRMGKTSFSFCERLIGAWFLNDRKVLVKTVFLLLFMLCAFSVGQQAPVRPPVGNGTPLSGPSSTTASTVPAAPQTGTSPSPVAQNGDKGSP